MVPELGKKYLITTEGWFYAPDGYQYRAVYGTVTSIDTDEDTLGVKTNRASTNWYVNIGNMLVAGCQIHYCIRTDWATVNPLFRYVRHEGEIKQLPEPEKVIYNADEGS